MWSPSAGLFAVLLLGMFFVYGEARPVNFGRSDLGGDKEIVCLGFLQRKILEDQQTPVWTETKNDKAEGPVKQANKEKWEPKVEEKKDWIEEPKVAKEESESYVHAEQKEGWHPESKLDGEQKEEWHPESKVEGKQEEWHPESKAEGKQEEWHPESKAEGEQNKEERHPESKVDGEQKEEWHQEAKIEGEKEEWHQEAKVEGEQAKVDEKEPWNLAQDWKEESKADEKTNNQSKEGQTEEKLIANKQDEQWKEAKVEEREPWNPAQDLKEESKAEEKTDNQSKEGQSEEKSVANKQDEQWKEAKVEEKKEDPWKHTSVEKREEEPRVEERKENPKVGERKEEKKAEAMVEVVKEAPNMEEQREEPKVEGVKDVEVISEEKKDDLKVEGKETLQVLDNKKEQPRVELKKEVRQESEENSPTALKVSQAGRPFETKIGEDANSTGPGQTVVDPNEDYPDFLEELRNFPERFQKTAESVKDHIRYSGLDKYSTHSKALFNQANQQIQESFTPLIGKDYAPFIAYIVSYGLLVLPLVLVMYFVERIRAIFSLQKILLFVNIYLSAYFAALLAASFILKSEPIGFFMKYSSSSYIFLQLLQAFGYLVYLLLNTVDLISTCSTGRIAAKFSAVVQWVVVVAVGFHYYVTVFHRAMARKAPLTTWKIYGLYSVSFIFLCLFARIERGKKQYAPQEEDDTTDKKN